MRHDHHYVDAIANRFDEPVGVHLPVTSIEPNPFQPRVRMEGLKELTASIRAKGVLEPLIVRRTESGGHQLVAGERRLRAAQAAELKTVPCIEIDVDDAEALEIALVENLQRRDLDPFEEGDGIAQLKSRFSKTNPDLAKELGKSKTVVSESLAIAKIPDAVRELCHEHSVLSRNALLQVARAGSRQKMEETVLKIAAEGTHRDELVKDRQKDEGALRGRPKNYRFKWQPEAKSFAVQIQFKKSKVSKKEVLIAVRQLLDQLEDDGQ